MKRIALSIGLVMLSLAVLVFLKSMENKQEQPAESSAVQTINLQIHFNNPGDLPGAVPYMSIIFIGLPENLKGSVDKWHKEMIRDIGNASIESPKDLEKNVSPTVLSHIKAFTSCGIKELRIEFPKERQGIAVFPKR